MKRPRGRPVEIPNAEVVGVTLRLPPEDRDWLERQGPRATVIRHLIQKARRNAQRRKLARP